MIDVGPHRQVLAERVAAINQLIDETHPPPPAVGAISREARGLAIVLLHAAYEELLVSLTRTILETAVKLRISNSRLQPGLRSFALNNATKSLRDVSDRKLFVSALPNIVELASRRDRTPTIDTGDFPSDGSFMKRSQVEVWAKVFSVGPPEAILRNIWDSIDGVVSQRNGVAHGRLTPLEVGRGYSESEIRQLVSDWATDWDAFLLHVSGLASTRDFFRTPK